MLAAVALQVFRRREVANFVEKERAPLDSMGPFRCVSAREGALFVAKQLALEQVLASGRDLLVRELRNACAG